MNLLHVYGSRLRLPALSLAILVMPAALCGYSIIDLGSFGGSQSNASYINNAGDVVGYAVVSGNDEAFYYNGTSSSLVPHLGGSTIVQPNGLSANGVMVGTAYAGSAPQAVLFANGVLTTLGTLGGLDSWGYGVNDSGFAVGASQTNSSPVDAFLYDTSTMAALGGTGTFGGNTYTTADFISDNLVNGNYQIAGNASGGDAFYYHTTFIPLTLGGTFSKANDMNASGVVVGESSLASGGNQQAFVYDPSVGPSGTITPLGTIDGTSTSNSDALAVNIAGQVVGYSDVLSGGPFHAFSDINSVMTDLGTLAGYSYSKAIAINASGEIVGEASTDSSFGTSLGSVVVPFLCLSAAACHAGQMIDLNTLLPDNSGWTLQTVSGINDAGEIIGQGTNSLGTPDAFLLSSSTPEPSTIATMILGSLLCGIGVRRSRKRRKL